MEYMSNHFDYGSRKNMVFRKMFEDIWKESSLTLPNNSNYMDGYGLCLYSKIINKELKMEFINVLNYLGLVTF